MSVDITILEKIDAYLDGSLSTSEKASFEGLMLTNPEIAKEVELAQVTRQVLIDYESSQLSRQITKDLANISHPQKINKWFIGGSTVLLLIGIIAWFAFPKEEASSNSTVKTSARSVKKSTHDQEPHPEKTTNDSPLIAQPSYPSSEDASTLEITKTTSEKREHAENTDNEEPSVTTKIKNDKKTESERVLVDEAKIEKDKPTSEANSGKKEILLEPITYKVNTSPTYKDEPTGKITIDVTKKDNQSYEYSIDNGESFQNFNKFDFLEEGEYTVVVKSGNQLSDSKTIILNALPCNKNYDKTFSPDAGMTWTVPAVTEISGNFKLQNQNGIVVYETTFEPYETIEWDGISNKNQQITSGYYRFTINYESGEACFGDLTILR